MEDIKVDSITTTEIKTIYTGDFVSMTVLMKDDELESISFRDVANNKHLFSLKYFRDWRKQILMELSEHIKQAVILLASVGE